MIEDLIQKTGASESAVVIISISLILLFGFLATRVTKLFRLPNVTAYIICGIVIGPFCLNLIPSSVINGMDFMTDIALAFIAFTVGDYFKIDTIKKDGLKVIVITLFEALMASIVVFVFMYFVFKFSISFSLVLAAIASATAPASTMMTIKQTGASGNFVDTIVEVVALDDAVSLTAFSIAIALSSTIEKGSVVSFKTVGLPAILSIGSVALGIGFGFLLKLFITAKRTKDNRLIIAIAFLLGLTGICTAVNTSPLLGCMAMGATYINVSKDEGMFKTMNYFDPPILLIFFVLSGMRLDINSLATLGVVGLVYFIVRIAGKYMGATFGSLIVKSTKENIRYLGLALIPQAGVSIGLAALGARILPVESGTMLNTIILASSVLYEMVGPACAKLSLYLTHSYEREAAAIPFIKTDIADYCPPSPKLTSPFDLDEENETKKSNKNTDENKKEDDIYPYQSSPQLRIYRTRNKNRD